jgi:hypothetical protein
VKKSADYVRHARDAAGAVENATGYSPRPSRRIAGLVCAADIAKNSDSASAATYLAKADEWQ